MKYKNVSGNKPCEIEGYHFILADLKKNIWMCKETGEEFVSCFAVPSFTISVSGKEGTYEFRIDPATRKPVCVSILGSMPMTIPLFSNRMPEWQNIAKTEDMINEKLDSLLCTENAKAIELHMYVDGPQEAAPAIVLATAKYCQTNGIPLSFWHHDKKRGRYWPQRMY